MGLQKHYLMYGRTARDHILGLAGGGRRNTSTNGVPTELPTNPSFRPRPTPISMLISQGVKLSNSK